MIKNRAKIYIFLIAVICVSITLFGCGKNVDTGALFDNALVSIKGVKSADLNMIISYELEEDYQGDIKLINEEMNCKIKTTDNPAITYTEAIDTTTYDGEKTAYDITSYTVESGDALISYSKSESHDGEDSGDNAYTDGKWYKSISEATGGQLKAQVSLLKICAKNEQNFSFDKNEKVNKIKCHKISGVVSGKELYEAIGKLGNNDTNNILEVYDGDADSEVGVEIWFNRKTSVPVRMRLKLNSLMENMLKNEDVGEDFSYKVNNYSIEFTFNSFDTVGILEVPDEVIEEAIATEESIPDDEELMKYFENVDLDSIGLRLDNIENWSQEDWEKAKDKLYEYYGISD